jgi:phenylalanyl-tRNA synthetase beta chain
MDLTPVEVGDRLAQRGAPLEGREDLGAQFAGLTVARVLSVEQHPNADRLSLCQVDAGGSTPVQVICGAPNVRTQAWYPFAPVGCSLPDGTRIKKAKIRGVQSEGMLCSERELGLGRDHSGILELVGDFTEGQALIEALAMDDVRLDVEVSPNRGDLLSHMGVARELAPEGHVGLSLPAIPGARPYEAPLKTDAQEVEAAGFRLRVEEPDLCPRFLAVVIRGVRVGPSPLWLANRLRSVGAQPINNVVDVTNYAMLEMGRPMHAYGLEKLKGSASVVRLAKEGETLETLDGVGRALGPEMLMVCDAEEPVGIGGVMGGGSSEVSDQTVDVLLECALWDPPNIRSTRRALDMSTDASYRFERGVDPEFHEAATRRAAELIMAVAGGEPDGELLDVCGRPWSAVDVPLRRARVRRVLGVDFDTGTLRGLLEPLGFEITGEDRESLTVRVPGFRTYDVRREIDLIEEVARTYGYDAFPESLGAFRPGTVPDHPLFLLEDALRTLLVGRGLLEAQIPAFAAESEGEVALNNPISSNDSHMRRWLLPGLLRRVAYNFARGARTVRLYELGTSFRKPDQPGQPPSEATHLAVTLTGLRAPAHWSGDAMDTDVWELKELAEAATNAAYGSRVRVVPGALDHPSLERAGLQMQDEGGEVIGVAGKVIGSALDAPAWAGPVWGLELTLPHRPDMERSIIAAPLPGFPGVERDFALLIPHSVAAATVRDVIVRYGGPLLVGVEIFDLYEGEELPQGHRSVAHRLRFQSAERTLKDAEVDRATKRILSKLKEELSVEARG